MRFMARCAISRGRWSKRTIHRHAWSRNFASPGPLAAGCITTSLSMGRRCSWNSQSSRPQANGNFRSALAGTRGSSVTWERVTPASPHQARPTWPRLRAARYRYMCQTHTSLPSFNLQEKVRGLTRRNWMRYQNAFPPPKVWHFRVVGQKSPHARDPPFDLL